MGDGYEKGSNGYREVMMMMIMLNVERNMAKVEIIVLKWR